MNDAKTAVNIIILDACRNNPLPVGTRSSISNDGLAPVYAPKGTLIAFSTSPGEMAQDTGSGRNSVYTGAFLNHIDDANIPIEEFFKRVRTSVHNATKGKQTSWEHTSLIGTFHFNSGQMVHASNIPYKSEYVADELFVSTGGEIDKIITDLKSRNWYTQKPALARFNDMRPQAIDKDSLFLIGRNILQTAEGDESSAVRFLENAERKLQPYTIDGENHLLNGILFEMYFNSKGQFRQGEFKNGLMDMVFKLEKHQDYTSAFEFIAKLLLPFKNFVLYIPTVTTMTVPIDVLIEKQQVVAWGDIKEELMRVVSIKHERRELLKSGDENQRFGVVTIRLEEFKFRLSKMLGIPSSRMRISFNLPEDEIKVVNIPWNLKLE